MDSILYLLPFNLNPVEEGLVFRAEDYVYSSAIDYSGDKGMLDIFVIE